MGHNNIFRLQFHLEKDQFRLILSDEEKELSQRNLPDDILKFMAAAQMQLDSLFENRIPLNRQQQRD